MGGFDSRKHHGPLYSMWEEKTRKPNTKLNTLQTASDSVCVWERGYLVRGGAGGER